MPTLFSVKRAESFIETSKSLARICGSLAFLFTVGQAADSQTPPKQSGNVRAEVPREVELRGSVVCLPEHMHKLYQTELPTNHEHLYGFKTNDGTFYTLLRTKFSEALFVDKRMREKELIVRGRVF